MVVSGQRDRRRPSSTNAPANSSVANTTRAVTKSMKSSPTKNKLARNTPPKSNPKVIACQSGRPARLSMRALTSRTCSSISWTAASNCASGSKGEGAGGRFVAFCGLGPGPSVLIRPRAARLLSSSKFRPRDPPETSSTLQFLSQRAALGLLPHLTSMPGARPSLYGGRSAGICGHLPLFWRTIFTYSLRRSSVSSGIETRITSPSLVGEAPRLGKLAMAFSISFIALLS